MLELETMADHARSPEAGLSRNVEMQQSILDDIALMLGRQFAVYTAVCQSAVAEKLEMPLADLKALDLIMEFEALPTGHLAQLMGISSGGATALINRLEAAGYVRRDRYPLDRRVIAICPVAQACEVVTQERQAIAAEVALVSRRYEQPQTEAVHGFLAQCVRAFRHDTLAWLETRATRRLDD
jgi:DNA-binding MarR family transcriptional regulator